MALKSEELIAMLDEKATIYIGESYTSMSTVMKAKIFRVIAESVVEYIQSNATVAVAVDTKTSTGTGTVI